MKKTTITIHLLAPQKHLVNGQTQDKLSDAEKKAVNQFIKDWQKYNPTK